MRVLNRVSTGLGMKTRDKVAEGESHAALAQIETTAREAGEAGIAILADGLRRLGGRKAVSGKLSRAYASALQERITAAGSQLKVRTDLSVADYASELLTQLKSNERVGADEAELVEDALKAANNLNRHPKLQRVNTLDDVATVFTQFVGADELRDKRKVFNGHEYGVAMPVLPLGLPEPWGLGAIAGATIKKEEMLEVGLYINLAEVTTTKADFRATAGASVDVGDASKGVGATAAHTREWQEVTTLSLRLPRKRGDEEKLRAQVPRMMQDMVRFSVQPPEEREHDSPIAMLLAENHDLAVVVSDDQGAITTNTGMRAGLGNFSLDHPVGGNILGISADLERAQEWKRERIGAFVTTDFTSSVKATINADVGVRIPVSLTDEKLEFNEDGKDRGSLRPARVTIPGVSGFRNFFQRLDKMQISEATAEGAVIDADIDEFYYSPDELLRDLEENREAWLQRGLETIMKRKGEDAVPPHQKDTVGRRLAEAELAQVEGALREMGKNDKFTQFNINYSLTDEAKAEIGEARLYEALAKKAGKADRAAAANQLHVQVLQDPQSWTPNKVMARVKAKVPVSVGNGVLAVAKKTFQVEGQRVPWQYPA
jgi:hypothetical protein